MFGPIARLPLSRRLAGSMLLCGLGCLGALLAGLSAADRSLDAVEVEIVRDLRDRIGFDIENRGRRNLSELLRDACSDPRVGYCGITGPDGRYTAHSVPAKVGRSVGFRPSLGDGPAVCKVSLPELAEASADYWMPLGSSKAPGAALQVGITGRGTGRRLLRLCESAPAALLTPFALLLIGAGAVRRAVAPASEIVDRLTRFPGPGNDAGGFPLAPVDGTGEAAAAWNRLVEEVRAARRSQSIERRLGELARGGREKRTARILDTLADGVAATDRDGVVTFANGAFAALAGGGNAEDLIGRRLTDLLGSLAGQEPLPGELLAPGPRPAAAELRRGSDLADGVVRVAVAPLTDGETAVAGHIWTLRDITQSRIAEAARNEFVGAASHELRTPLANIKAYAETLLDGDVDADAQKDFCNTINAEATRLARFVDDLLDVSRIETGALSLNRHDTDVRRLLEEAARKVQAQVEQKRLAFELRLPPKLPEMAVDKDAVSAAVVNLLSNAVKYTPDGGAVTVTVEQDAKEVRVQVEDTGFGIPAEEMPRLFRKFFRSGDPRVRAVTGSGLGLAFAHEVARLHGGRLTVVSELNKGSRFTLALPVG